MAITEDDLAQALIKWGKETSSAEEEFYIYPEARYNHYGDRGVADLYLETVDNVGNTYGHLLELKSESAVREATGANEIIRQYNKMREFFFPGSSHRPPNSEITIELCFSPSEYNLRHVADNADLYSAAVEQTISNLGTDRTSTMVSFRPPNPEHIIPIIMFRKEFDFRTRFKTGDHNKFVEYVERTQPAIFEEYEEILRKIVEEAG